MDTLASYDELPYDSLPLPETQPDFLAAVARLHGFEAPDPRRARILELGCAQGGNLIPLAWRWPESECVGVELSRVQADAGADFVRRLGLRNVRIVHGDLARLADDLGEFDYIVAHGVYSWVPPAVQQALLDVCRRHLTANGLAYVSFNVAAGWEVLQPLRDALLARTAADAPAPVRYRQALSALDALEAEWTDPVLLKEIAHLKQAAPSYLFHEYLADFNVPLRFAEFAAQLDAHELRYVGEAGPRHAVVELEDAWGLAPEGMTGRWLDAEAALDDARATRFRRALVARSTAPCAAPPRDEALHRLAFYADVSCDEEIDLQAATEQRFRNPAGNAFPVTEPAAKAALMVLSAAYPSSLGYAAVRRATEDVMRNYGGAAGVDEIAFRGALFELVMAHAVMPTVLAVEYANEVSSRPCAHALAREQARDATWVVSGARHVALDVDVYGRTLLALLDGDHSLDALTAAMQAKLADASQSMDEGVVAELTRQQLWLFARQGVLPPEQARAVLKKTPARADKKKLPWPFRRTFQ
jgi:SAM-dependent methyltransferase